MKTILVEGGSSAAGWHDFERGGYVNRLATASLRYNVDHKTDPLVFKSNATPGKTVKPATESFRRDADYFASLGSVFCTLAVGLNESKIYPPQERPVIGLDLFKRQLSTFCGVAQERHIPLVLIGPPPIDDVRVRQDDPSRLIKDAVTSTYGEAMRTASDGSAIHYVDAHALLSAYPLEEVLHTDGLHPNAFGHALLEKAIAGSLIDAGLTELTSVYPE